MKKHLYRLTSILVLIATVFIVAILNNNTFHAGYADADSLAAASGARIANGKATEEQVANGMFLLILLLYL